MPATAVSLPVTNGLFSVGLGDTAVAGMTIPVPASIFGNAGLRIRVWFSDGVAADAVIADHAITSTGYAFFAQSVADGSITSGKIAVGAVNSAALANDVAFTTLRLEASGTETVTLAGSTGAGEGALFTLRNGSGAQTLVLDSDTAGHGSSISLYNAGGFATVALDSHPSGSLVLRDSVNLQTVELLAAASLGEGATLNLRNGNNRTTAILDGDSTARGGGLFLYNSTEILTARLRGAESPSTGSRLDMYRGDGARTVVLDAEGDTGGGFMEFYKANGTRTVWIEADSAGEGRITTQVLEITGGSDFSENFEIRSEGAQPGMLVKIDPAHPGELALSDRDYDRTVAGVVSGAGGVKPGVLMGQRATIADGRRPVALTGRVYCLVDADRGAIEPGDLITTSDTPGHGMKVGDHARAQGAVIGKAMTGLASGRGLVLVLVSLQ
jgi:hypothetical protein